MFYDTNLDSHLLVLYLAFLLDLYLMETVFGDHLLPFPMVLSTFKLNMLYYNHTRDKSLFHYNFLFSKLTFISRRWYTGFGNVSGNMYSPSFPLWSLAADSFVFSDCGILGVSAFSNIELFCCLLTFCFFLGVSSLINGTSSATACSNSANRL